MIIRIYRILTAVFLLIAVVGSLFLPRRDLKKTAQVAGIALDEENGQIRATFELYVPAVDDVIGMKRKTVVGYGDTLEECIENVRFRSGDTLFVNDAAALVIEGRSDAFLMPRVFEYFRLLKNNHMDLSVFFAFGQSAGEVFEGEGAVLSTALAQSSKSINRVQTVKNLMNSIGERVFIRGKGGYEIIS